MQERERHTSCPPPTADGPARERENSNSGRILTLRSGKSRTSTPLLSEKDARAVCRNAQDLLKYHERFVEELRDAIGVTSFRVAFIQGSENDAQRAEEVVAEEVERAVELVAAKFVDEVRAHDFPCPA